ncbi:MAG: GNAT family N-acetyltransferase [Runella sp.]
MRVRFYLRSQIDDERWDYFISHSPQSILYAQSWYLDAVSPRWGALIAEENDQWQAVMPLPFKKKWGFAVVQQPLFCQFLGVFTKSGVGIAESEKLLLEALPQHFRYISIYAGRFGSNAPFPPSFKQKTAKNYILSLGESYKSLQKNYSSDRCQNLKRAKKWSWICQESEDIEPLIQLFKTYHASQIEGGVAESAYQTLRKIFAQLLQKQVVRLHYAIRGGQIEAGVMFVVWDKRIIYLFNAASDIGRQGNARTWLIDNMIQSFAQSDYTFDFESPAIESIAGFYRSFGATAEPYTEIRYNGLPFPLKQWQAWRLQKINYTRSKLICEKTS